MISPVLSLRFDVGAARRRLRTGALAALVLLLAPWPSSPAHAQLAVPGAAESATDSAGGAAPTAPEPAPADPLGRETPEGLVVGLLKAMASEDYARAARYFDMSGVFGGRGEARGAELARQLQQLLDKGGWVAANWQLSREPAGQLNDGLEPHEEEFANVRTPDGMVKLIADRVADPQAGQIWLVSSRTLRQVPYLLGQTNGGMLERLMPQTFSEGPRIAGVPVAHWAALVALAVVAYLLAWIVTSFAVAMAVRLLRRGRHPRAERSIRAASKPFQLYLSVWVFTVGAIFLGVSVIARQQFGYLAEIVAWIALAWLVWRVVDSIAEISIERMSRRGRFGALSAVRFFRRSAKFVVAAIAAIAALDTIGLDVTAGLAALGIGGIAIALGAQKTIENFIGSLTVVADQPVRVGDFCRFGATLGTVEDIGMRSTRIRTQDRTIVTVPNGEFSSLQIENYTRRDCFWFHPMLGLRYETTPDQIRYLLEELRALLREHPQVNAEPTRVRFLGLGADSLTIEVYAYVSARDYAGFLEVQEDLTLRIMDIIADSGASLAFPSQTLYMARDASPDDARRRAAEARVRAWREPDEMHPANSEAGAVAAFGAPHPIPHPENAARPSSPGGRPS